MCYEDPYGNFHYFENGKRHRLDRPAVECIDGTKYWFVNDKLHRLDGPAVEHADGTKQYWINDINISILKNIFNEFIILKRI